MEECRFENAGLLLYGWQINLLFTLIKSNVTSIFLKVPLRDLYNLLYKLLSHFSRKFARKMWENSSDSTNFSTHDRMYNFWLLLLMF